MNTLTILPEQNAAPRVMTETQIIEQLRKYTLERKFALKAYAVYNQEKLEAVQEILFALDKASLCLSPCQALQIVLHQALNLHFIAPRGTKKLFYTWYSKIEDILQACRNYLGGRIRQC